MNRSRPDQIRRRPSEQDVEYGSRHLKKKYCMRMDFSSVLEEKMKESIKLVLP